MKKLSCLLILVLHSIISLTQEYQSILGTKSTTWYQEREAIDRTDHITIRSGNDTTVGTTNYVKLEVETPVANTLLLIREEISTRKVWVLDTAGHEEYLIMDLTLIKGDAFTINEDGQSIETTVDTVYYTDGKKVIRLDYEISVRDIRKNLEFIEGTGPNAGIIYQINSLDDNYPAYQLLLCQYKDGALAFKADCADDNCLFDNTGSGKKLLEPGTLWHYSFREGMDTPDTGYLRMEVEKDTTVEEKLCKKLIRTYVNSDGETSVLNAEIIYYNPLEKSISRYFEGDFLPLYDFSAGKGTILEIPVPGGNSISDTLSFVVDSVKEIVIDNTVLTAQYVHLVEASSWDLSSPFIEGIGAMNYFFPVYSLDCNGGCPTDIRCFQNGTIFYYSHEGVDCEALINNIGESSAHYAGIIAYPQPATDFLHLEGQEKMKEIRIYNVDGSLAEVVKPDSERYTINCTDLRSGVYILAVFNVNSVLIGSIPFVKR